ncbi:RNA dependent RNA polymerase [Red clover powdery mildew-associated totivirus 6]|uniref:RNA-directed RNA polymerase n=1 Tax=Red clover powdery mildew-associated totivirus 6 TaxID=1714367 RepID=A0A0S3Q2B1_9VIRU|nr:RNA dependent RNA polymerase [Red clover powdery mildew-associated totivirus 6]BAT62488.1 RNA dependent RNA polymerase [Red clover powdery mildew-associated totivirus 6]
MDGIARSTTFERASYSLVEIIPGIDIRGQFFCPTYDGAMRVCSVYYRDLHMSAMYLSHVESLPALLPAARVAVSRTQFGYDLCPLGCVSQKEHLAFLTNYSSEDRYTSRHFEKLSAVLAGRIELPHEKASATHLRHIVLADIAAVMAERQQGVPDLGNVAYLLENAIRDGWATETFVVGMILWVLALRQPIRGWVLGSKWWLQAHANMKEYHDFIKTKLSLRAKALQNLVGVDLSQLFEVEVLVNRGMGQVDWKAERLHRVRPSLATFGVDAIRAEACKLFTKSKQLGGKLRPRDWGSYWDTRWMWAPTGAFFSQHPEDKAYLSKDFSSRSKFYALSSMPDYGLEHFLGRRCEIQAKASQKYEWGKMRAIYGTDVTSFVLTNFCMGDCEEFLEPVFPLKEAATLSHVKARVKDVLNNGVPYCFDFEDFNSQHSGDAMEAVLLAFGEVCEDMMSHEQRAAFEWTCGSIGKQTIHSPDGKDYTTKHTLLSGWRLTTFMNTVLNYIYVQLCSEGELAATIHTGDDVLAAVENLGAVATLQRNAIEHNVRFQRSKCFLGGLAEFVRVDHLSGTGAQYLARACSSFVHGPMDMSIPFDPLAQVEAMHTRTLECKERGADVELMNALERRAISYVLQVTDCENVNVDDILNTHVAYGGMSREIDEGAVANKIERRAVVDLLEEPPGPEEDGSNKILPGCKAYARHVARTYNLQEHELKIRRRVQQALDASVTKTKYAIRVVKNVSSISQSIARISQFKKFANIKLGMKANLAKAFGVPLTTGDSTQDVKTAMLISSEDQLAALRLWF